MSARPTTTLPLLCLLAAPVAGAIQDPRGGGEVQILAGPQDPPRSRHRRNVTFHNRARAHYGLNAEVTELDLASPIGGAKFRLFDNSGRVLKTWSDPLPGFSFGELVKPVAGGHILAVVRQNTARERRLMVELDWNGVPVWVFDPTTVGVKQHHDFVRLASGNTLLLTQARRVEPSIRPAVILDDILIEVNNKGDVVWQWSTVDHASDLPLTEPEWAYLRNLGTGAIFHSNSIQTLPPNRWEAEDPRFRAGNILVSQRVTNLVFLIDRESGQIVWSFKGAIGQHHARMIPNELPGAGNILLFDNGGSFGAPPVTRQYSRVVEIDPRTRKTVWSYDCREGSRGCSGVERFGSFWSTFMGGAQRLPNGNTLITEAAAGRVFEVTPEGGLVWEYWIEKPHLVYRATRWDPGWRRESTGKFPW